MPLEATEPRWELYKVQAHRPPKALLAIENTTGKTQKYVRVFLGPSVFPASTPQVEGL